MYGLHPLIPTKYIVLVASGDKRHRTLMKILTSRSIKFEKLQEFSSGIKHYGVSKRIWKKNLVLVIMFCGFQRAKNHT